MSHTSGGGVPSERGLEEDAKAALHWLRSRKGTLFQTVGKNRIGGCQTDLMGFHLVERITLIGHSLGTVIVAVSESVHVTNFFMA